MKTLGLALGGGGARGMAHKYFIDGGATNLVPFDIIRSERDILAAIDIPMTKPRSAKPGIRSSARAAWAGQ